MASRQHLKFVNHIYDNVHGYIGLTAVEREIERLPIFQRLRHLRQLGLVSWVFPGAEHSRYIHSLGVMHLIDAMAIRLNFNSRDRQKLRLAALLHDIGHYPLSHIGEGAYKSVFKHTAACQNAFKQNANLTKTIVDKFLNSGDPEQVLSNTIMKKDDNEYHHERVAVWIIKNSSRIQDAIKRYAKPADLAGYIQDLCDIITGNSSSDDLACMVQLLHSELDADRLDYLLRDASFSGTSYGKIEAAALIRSLTIGEHPNFQGVKIIGINDKGIGAAEQFLVGRFMAYGQIIYNKHISILHYMAEEVTKWLIQNQGNHRFFDLASLKQAIEKHEEERNYIEFTDDTFFESVYTLASECTEPTIKMFAKYLREHRAPEVSQRMGTCTFVGTTKDFENFSPMKEEIYLRLTDSTFLKRTSSIGRVDVCRVTNHVPLVEFQHAFNIYVDINKKSYDQYFIHRLQHGITYVPKKGAPMLLIDYEGSIVKDVVGCSRVYMRRYTLKQIS